MGAQMLKVNVHVLRYLKEPKYSDRYDLEKMYPKFSGILSFRTDRPGQTVQTQIRSSLIRATLFAILSASFGCITLR